VRPLHLVSAADALPSSGVASAVLDSAQVALPLAGLLDVAAERDKLTAQLEEARAEVSRVEGKLANAEFRSKAPAQIVAREEERLAAARTRVEGLQRRLEEMS
jgi:valyl-tRNA synthetase